MPPSEGELVVHRSSLIRRILLGGVLIGVLPGCQWAYDYELRGTIKRSSDGAPLFGVLVTPEASGLWKTPAPVVTGIDGSFLLKFRVSDGEFSPREMPKWSLRLETAGYVDEVVDISPLEEPKRGTTTQMVVIAYMREVD